MSTTLPLFWNLSSNTKAERIDASVNLIAALQVFQLQHVGPRPFEETAHERDVDGEDEDPGDGNDGDRHTKNSDRLDRHNAPDVSYSIRRLIRGLASPRESSRLGFAVALTELLSRVDTISCSQILNLVLDASQTSGSMTGQEERDMLFARLFGLAAIVQSGLLVRSTALRSSSSNETEASSLLSFEAVISELVKLGDKKSFLRQSSWWSLCLVVDMLETSSISWKKQATKHLIKILFEDDKGWFPEKIALTVRMQALHPKKSWSSLLSPTFKEPLLQSANLHAIARILKESSYNDEEGSSSAASWTPMVHFVWDIILDGFIPPSGSQSPSGSLQDFFRIVVDESLFSSTSSSQRKYWGFQIFQKALPRITLDELPMLFTKNFMRCWINHLSNNDRYLHKAARQVATDICKLAENNPTVGFTLVLQLTGIHGSQRFDRLTRTKTIESILTTMDLPGLDNFIHHLLSQVNGSDADLKSNAPAALERRRLWIIDQVTTLIRNGAVPKGDKWVKTVLDWLVIGGFFDVKKGSSKSEYFLIHSPPSPAFTENVQEACRNKLFICLAELTNQPLTAKKKIASSSNPNKAAAIASDGEFWVEKVLSTIIALEKHTENVEIHHRLDADSVTLCGSALDIVSRLKKLAVTGNEPALGGVLLLTASLLHLYSTSDSDDNESEAFESCLQALSEMFPREGEDIEGRRKWETDPTVDSELADSLEPVDLLVDTLIGYLEASTGYMRAVANQVFTLISSMAKASTIDLIITGFDQSSLALETGANNLTSGDDHEENESSDEESQESRGSDDEEREASDGGMSNEDMDPDLRKKLGEAIRTTGDDDSSEEELMDDDQMMAIDEQLAAVFRAQKTERKSGKGVNAHREATHFKNRLLDLADIYLKKHQTNPLATSFVLPLLAIIISSGPDETQLADKATGILRSRICKCKETPTNTNREIVAGQLEQVHQLARRKAHSAVVLECLNKCSIYLSRALFQAGCTAEVLRVYRDSLADFITRKNSSLNRAFLQEFVCRHYSVAWELRDDLLALAPRAVNSFRLSQTIQLLDPLLKHISLAPERDVQPFLKSLNGTLYDVANSALEKNDSLNAPQLRDILKTALLAVRQTSKVLGSGKVMEEIWIPTEWQEFTMKLASSARFKGSNAIQKLVRQMISVSSAGSASLKTATKRKADNAPVDGGPLEMKAKRRKNTKSKNVE